MLSACFVPAYVLNRKELKPHFKEIIPLNAENYFRLLLYFRLFIRILLTVNKCSFKVTDDWIQTQVIWCQKRPLQRIHLKGKYHCRYSWPPFSLDLIEQNLSKVSEFKIVNRNSAMQWCFPLQNIRWTTLNNFGTIVSKNLSF